MNSELSKTVNMALTFGEFCAVGNQAASYLISDVYPVMDKGAVVVFDFEGVRNMNSSFSNAMFANIVRRYGVGAAAQLEIKNIRANVKTEVRSSFSLAKLESRAQKLESNDVEKNPRPHAF